MMKRQAVRLVLCCLLLGGPLAASGCGFQPVYSPSGRGIGPVDVALIDGRTGFLVQQELARKAALERGTTPVRRLEVELTTSFIQTNQGSDGFFSRTQMTVAASWTLQGQAETPDGRGAVSVMVGYDSQDQAFGEVALQADAEERAAVLLADRIWSDVATRAPLPARPRRAADR